jgi:phosphoglycolate phosphatase
VLSATDQFNLDSMMDHFELRHIFKFTYGIDNKFAASKVNRGHELMSQSKFSQSETVLIGDTRHDLEVAEALGIDAILVSHGHQCATRLRGGRHVVIDVKTGPL